MVDPVNSCEVAKFERNVEEDGVDPIEGRVFD